MVVLDLVGNVTLALQVSILFLLIFGLPFVRASNSKRNIVWHGYSTVIALILHTILILVVMVPSFTGGLGNISSLSVLEAFNVWSHVILGVTAEALGIIMIVVWLSKPRAVIACAKTRKWMIPPIHNMDNFPNQRHPNTYTRIAIEILEPHNMHAVSKIKSLDNF